MLRSGSGNRGRALKVGALTGVSVLAVILATGVRGQLVARSYRATEGTRAESATHPPTTFSAVGARLLAKAVTGRAPASNTVLSPASAGITLSLALLGARGTTAATLASLLGFADDDRLTAERGTRALLGALRARTDVQLEIATAVWVDTAATLDRAFQRSASGWGATVGTLSLSSPAALASINRWASEATHGRIKNLLDDTLPDTTRLFLANAVYFKGKWQDPFDKTATHARDFVTSHGRRVQMQAMERTGGIAYRRAKDYQVVRLPYRGEHVAMYIILPDSGVAATRLAQRFGTSGWPNSPGERDEREIQLVLPKLHVEQAICVHFSQDWERAWRSTASAPTSVPWQSRMVLRLAGCASTRRFRRSTSMSTRRGPRHPPSVDSRRPAIPRFTRRCSSSSTGRSCSSCVTSRVARTSSWGTSGNHRQLRESPTS